MVRFPQKLLRKFSTFLVLYQPSSNFLSQTIVLNISVTEVLRIAQLKLYEKIRLHRTVAGKQMEIDYQ